MLRPTWRRRWASHVRWGAQLQAWRARGPAGAALLVRVGGPRRPCGRRVGGVAAPLAAMRKCQLAGCGMSAPGPGHAELAGAVEPQ
eukprot:934820-Alexandrium_andersonii.AAC.1